MTYLLLPESRQGPTSGPLNFLFALPQILFPKLPKSHFLILSEDFFKGHLFSRSSLTVLKNNKKSYNHHHPSKKFFQPFCLLFSSPSSESSLHFCILFVLGTPPLEFLRCRRTGSFAVVFTAVSSLSKIKPG